MTIDTRQLFGVNSDGYAAARPRYPREIFEYLIALCPSTARAWDCGTGSGQAAVALAEWFPEVEATDVSAQQIANAARHERVRYSVQPAERTTFPAGHFNLVTVAQALHWFDFDRFWPEVHRVLQSGGIFAAWTYTTPHLSAELDAIIESGLFEVIRGYWAPHNQLAWDAYANVPFPFQELVMPPIVMRLEWNLNQFVAYLGTWSATRLCIEANGPAFFDAMKMELGAAWGDPEGLRTINMDFFGRVGRHS